MVRRYPIWVSRNHHDVRMTPDEMTELIAAYRSGSEQVRQLVAGCSDSELDRRHPEGWSARMVIHHLADSETNSYVRLRRLLAEPLGTTIQGYDEALWASSPVLGYSCVPITHSLAVFLSVRAATSDLLDRISVEDLDRYGVHTESGPYKVSDWLAIYAAHATEHAEQIRRALNGEQ